MCTGRLLSQGIDLFALKFYVDRVLPQSTSTILSVRKLETLGYPTVKTTPFAFPDFDIIPECDGRTDRRTDLP